MKICDLKFQSRKALLTKMKSLRKRLPSALLLVIILAALSQPGFPTTIHKSVILGRNATLSCPFIGNVTMVSWKFNESTITALRCEPNESIWRDNNHTRMIIKNTACNKSNNKISLQIQPVILDDDGNYTCEITGEKGIHKVTFFLLVIVPPTVSLSIENKSNETVAICIASNGKPASEITWHPTNTGNTSINTTIYGNKTITVQNKNIITTHLFNEQIICSVSHPAFNGTQNYTIAPSNRTPNNLRGISMYLLCACLISGIMVGFLCIFAVIYFKHLQKKTSIRSTCNSGPTEGVIQSNGPFIQMENLIYETLQPEKMRQP
ncbi:cell surface glycoprotein CD200 receptor 1-B-like [Hypanus sabinus]|uniref:cell surface glycoprotein CD200 receptor 1-B-like n=1 Tax=Hypanus sabinus TaxID=79690 RepID=UPI0028C3DD6F|nr:cell surface glycoprotein CD200 receptor 1-B-like [Hypanus sabinus]